MKSSTLRKKPFETPKKNKQLKINVTQQKYDKIDLLSKQYPKGKKARLIRTFIREGIKRRC